MARLLLLAEPENMARLAADPLISASRAGLILDFSHALVPCDEAEALAARRLAPRPIAAIRVPALSDANFASRLAWASAPLPAALLLPDLADPTELEELGAHLAVYEASSGTDMGETKIIATLGGQPGAFTRLAGLASASPRLAALVFDGEILAHRLGLPMLSAREAHAIETARSLALLAAAQARIPLYEFWRGSADPPPMPAALEARARRAQEQGCFGLVLGDWRAAAPAARVFVD